VVRRRSRHLALPLDYLHCHLSLHQLGYAAASGTRGNTRVRPEVVAPMSPTPVARCGRCYSADVEELDDGRYWCDACRCISPPEPPEDDE
jgi:hypothetical protein